MGSAVVVSCAGFLDEEPISNITDKNYYSTETDAEGAVNAIYETVGIGSVTAYTGEGNANTPYGGVFFNVYWIIKGNPKLKISLSADGAMTGETPNNKINWKVSWDTDRSIGTDENYSTDTSASYSGVQVHVVEKTIDVGSKPLTIITQDITDATADSYTGKLILTIEATESSATTEETV